MLTQPYFIIVNLNDGWNDSVELIYIRVLCAIPDTSTESMYADTGLRISDGG